MTRLLFEVTIALVSQIYHVPPLQILSAHRSGAKVARARQIAMYLCSVGCQLSQREIAGYFGRTRKTVRHACHRVEDWRDDPEVDERLESLERSLYAIATRSRNLFH